VTRRRLVPLAAWLAALALAAALAAGARYSADLSAFLPRAPTPTQQLLVDQLRDGAVGRVMLGAIEGADATARARLSRELAERLRADARFAYVANGAALGSERERKLLFEHRYLLSPAVTPERFSADGLREAIGETLDLVASSAGGLAQALLARDPTGEMSLIAASHLGAGPRPALFNGVWVSRDGERALLVLRTAAVGADTDAQEAAMGATRAAFAAALERVAAPQARLRLTGAGVFAVESRALIKREVVRVATLGVVLIAALLLLAYRSPRALALGLLPVLTGALVGVAAVAAGFGVVHGITLGFGATLIGESVDYAIYLFVQSGAAQGARGAWLDEFWPTIRLGVLTSMIGFAALLLSGFPGLAQLVLYSVCGLAAAALFTRYVLPQLLPDGFHVRELAGFGARLSGLRAAAPRWRWLVALLCAAALVTLFAQRGALWASDLSALSTVSAEDADYDGRLRADLGAPDARYLLVAAGSDQQEALRAAERVAVALHPLVAQGVIAGYDSPARYLPSDAAQTARAASLPEPRELRARLARALHGLPLRPARLEGFIADATQARAGVRLTRADLEGSALGLAVDALLQQRAGGWHALLPLRAPATGPAAFTIDAARVREALLGSGALFIDLKAEANALYDGYLHEAIALAAAGVAAVLLLLMIALRSAARVGRVAAPLGAAVLVTAAILAAAGQPLTLLHLVGFLLVVAVGSNYALFFERAGGAPAPRVLVSIALANATTVIGFGVLATSSVPVLRAIGATVALGTLLALAFAALLSGARGDAR
jgi:predicted exporter